MDKVTLQLQLWDPAKKAYVLQADAQIGRYRAWRKCRPERSLKPESYKRATGSQYNRSIGEVRAQYLQWARERGQTVCDWEHMRYAAKANNADRFVDKVKYFEVEESQND